MIRTLIFAVWLIVVMVTSTVCLEMLSAPNTVENCMGLLAIVAIIGISIKTNCFIKILKLWKKESKSQSEQ